MSTLLDAVGTPLDDAFPLLTDDAAPTPGASALVSLERWQREAATLAAHDAGVAVLLPNIADVAALAPGLLDRPLLALSFPAFADGRGYSQAALLRRLGYAGRLRATGAAVVADQLVMLRRTGFDELALRDDESLPRAQALLRAEPRTAWYQPDRRGATPVARLRAGA